MNDDLNDLDQRDLKRPVLGTFSASLVVGEAGPARRSATAERMFRELWRERQIPFFVIEPSKESLKSRFLSKADPKRTV